MATRGNICKSLKAVTFLTHPVDYYGSARHTERSLCSHCSLWQSVSASHLHSVDDCWLSSKTDALSSPPSLSPPTHTVISTNSPDAVFVVVSARQLSTYYRHRMFEEIMSFYLELWSPVLRDHLLTTLRCCVLSIFRSFRGFFRDFLSGRFQLSSFVLTDLFFSWLQFVQCLCILFLFILLFYLLVW